MTDRQSAFNSQALTPFRQLGGRLSEPRGGEGAARLIRVAALAVGDAVVVIALVVTLTLLGRLFGATTAAPLALEAGVAALLVAMLHGLHGMYDRWRSKPMQLFRLRVICAALFVTCAGFYAAQHTPLAVAAAQLVMLFGGVVLGGSLAAAAARHALLRADLWLRPVVIVGPPAATSELAAALRGARDHDFRVVATATVDGCRGRTTGGTDCALLVSTGDSREDLRIADELPFPSVIILRDVGLCQTLWLSAHPVGNSFGLEVRRSLLVPGNLRIKRLIDLALTVPLLIAALPVIGACAAMIMLIDGGSPFYRQVRVGHQGRPFGVLKLRTMCVDAEARLQDYLARNPEAQREWERYHKLTHDPRILPVVGQFFRRFSFDELPQLINVLRGEMSLIGPRPFPAYHMACFDAEFQALRQAVIPGLSGLWQVTDRSDGDLEHQRRADTYYIRNWSIWLDLFILVQTLPAVISARGAR